MVKIIIRRATSGNCGYFCWQIDLTIMKKLILLSIAAIINAVLCSAQYYHRDLLSVHQANAELLLFKKLGIREIKVHSFEPDGTPSKGFRCEKKCSRDYRTIETITESQGTASSLMISKYNEQGRLVSASDSSEITAASNLYEYDNQGNIIRITSFTHSSDEDFITSLKEVHEYTYAAAQRPSRMLRIKNDRDTAVIEFKTDAHGWITDEMEKTTQGRHYYYYYTDSGRLSDIVRFNPVKGALSPDYIFEYNSQGQLSKMITVEEGLPGSFYNDKDQSKYLSWQYFYDDDGLRIIEKCFAGKTQLVGYLEYEYD